MTLGEVVRRITDSGIGQYDAETITGWVNEIEAQIADEIVSHAEGFDPETPELDYEREPDRVLTAPDRFQDVYLCYVAAKIDYRNQETERYNNDVAMFNAAYAAYAAWFRRLHRQKSRVCFSRF